jgi:hypothetical protein
MCVLTAQYSVDKGEEMNKRALNRSIMLLLGAFIISGCLYGVKSIQSKAENEIYQGAEISGTVINHDGRPVAEAQVIASPARGHTGILPHTFTDAKGNFRIVGLNAESYFMEAQKESDGYASTFGTFHSAGFAEAPLISVAQNQVVTGVILRFGPKSARLTGRIIDAKTKKSVEDAEIILRRVSNPRQFYSTSSQSKFNVLVPPVPFTIEVKSSG